MKKTAEAQIKLSRKAFEQRDVNRGLFEDCYDLYSPFKNTFVKQEHSLRRPTRQYTSVGQSAATNFVNTLLSDFIPPYTQWMKLEAGESIREEDRRIKLNKFLQQLTDVFFAYLDASNFSTVASEMFFDWGIGTGAMMFLEGSRDNPFEFVSVPMSELGVLEGKNSELYYKCREYSIEGHLIEPTWPKAKLPEDVKRSIQQNPSKEHQILETFYYDYEDFVWRHDVVLSNSKEVIHSIETQEEFFITPRWMRVPGFTHGVGPFLMALADTKTLNAFTEFQLRSAALDAAGVYTVASDGVINVNNIDIRPNTFIPVERNGGENGPSIQKLDTGGNYQLQEFLANQLIDQIRKTMLDNKLPAETPQPKTAFEIAERIKEFQTDIGAAYPRGMREFAFKVMRRGISILQSKGIVELPQGFNIDNIFTKIRIVSPIAQLQRFEDLQKAMQSYEMARSIDPAIAATAFEVEKFPGFINEMAGAPAKLLRDSVQVEALQEKVAQMVANLQLQAQGG